MKAVSILRKCRKSRLATVPGRLGARLRAAAVLRPLAWMSEAPTTGALLRSLALCVQREVGDRLQDATARSTVHSVCKAVLQGADPEHVLMLTYRITKNTTNEY